MALGIKISKEGFDVKTAGNGELSLSSSLNVFKVAQSGTGTVNASSTLEITHSLGYVPNYFVFIDAVNLSGSPVSGSRQLLTGNEQNTLADVRADSTKLYMTDWSGNNRNVLYYIMHDPA
jgi:hypothetical protein